MPLVHVNYTTTSGPQRLDALLPEEADKLKETPFAVVQVTHQPLCWRHQDPAPLNGFSETSRMGPTTCLP